MNEILYNQQYFYQTHILSDGISVPMNYSNFLNLSVTNNLGAFVDIFDGAFIVSNMKIDLINETEILK